MCFHGWHLLGLFSAPASVHTLSKVTLGLGLLRLDSGALQHTIFCLVCPGRSPCQLIQTLYGNAAFTVDFRKQTTESSQQLRGSCRFTRASLACLFRYTLDEFGTARRCAVVRGFIDALTRGGPGGTPRPIEMHSHDPLRYIYSPI